MARPRIFISSTFFDLKQVRNDVARFLTQLGYEVVLAERGEIPYSSDRSLEDSCYREVDNCDMIVVIIGGSAGSSSADGESTIVERELKAALDAKKQIWVFVDSRVSTEHGTWKINKDVPDFKPRYAQSVKVFELLNLIGSLGINNATFPFDTTEDLNTLLREQLLGLFQVLLRGRAEARRAATIKELEDIAQTYRQMLGVIAKAHSDQAEAIDAIRTLNHPAFPAFKQAVNTPYPTYFLTLEEMSSFLEARSWEDINSEHWDDPEFMEWLLDNKRNNSYRLLKISKYLFDANGKLRIVTDQDWSEDWINVETRNRSTASVSADEYDPFANE